MALPLPELFSPSLRAADPVAAHWLRQVTLHLRREICWLWRERGKPDEFQRNDSVAFLPFTDRLDNSLDLARYAAERERFFADDETAAYLSQAIAQPVPRSPQALAASRR